MIKVLVVLRKGDSFRGEILISLVREPVWGILRAGRCAKLDAGLPSAPWNLPVLLVDCRTPLPPVDFDGLRGPSPSERRFDEDFTLVGDPSKREPRFVKRWCHESVRFSVPV